MPLSICPQCGENLSDSCFCCAQCGTVVNGIVGSLEPITPTPELLEWAKQQFTEAEIVAGIEEIERTGGLELHEFIQELEAGGKPLNG